MLTNEKFAAAAAIAKTGDNAPAVIIEYITMPKDLRERVSRSVFEKLEQSGLTLAEFVEQNRAALQKLAVRNTMSLTVLVAFLLDIFEERDAQAAEARAETEA